MFELIDELRLRKRDRRDGYDKDGAFVFDLCRC